MKRYPTPREHGIALIEVLIAFVILTLGVSGIVQLTTVMTREAGQSRERSLAYALAQQKLDEFRRSINSTQYNNLISALQLCNTNTCSEIVTAYAVAGGQGTSFTRTWGLAGNEVFVTVNWTNVLGTNQAARVSSRLAYVSPAVADASAQDPLGAKGGKVKPPTGSAVAAPVNGTLGSPANVTERAAVSFTGFSDVEKGKLGNEFVLIYDNKIVLKSTNQQDFSSIGGTIYINAVDYDRTRNNQRINRNSLFVTISDASFCALSPRFNAAATQSDPNQYPALPGTGTTQYYAIQYRCFFGADWYGNIGVIRLDSAQTSDHVCVGSTAGTNNLPQSSMNTNAANTITPAATAVRSYRGFIPKFNFGAAIKTNGSAFTQEEFCGLESNTVVTSVVQTDKAPPVTGYDSFGIGRSFKYAYNQVPTTVGDYCAPLNTYAPVHYYGHDFVLARLQGQRSCTTEITALTAVAGSNQNNASPYNQNTPGRNYCFPHNIASGGLAISQCPNNFPAPVAPSIQLSGNLTLNNIPAQSPTPVIRFGGQDCIVTGNGNSRTYSCTNDLSGFNASTWNDFLTVQVTGSNFLATIGTPSPTGVTASTRTASQLIDGTCINNYTLSGPINILNPSVSITISSTGGCP